MTIDPIVLVLIVLLALFAGLFAGSIASALTTRAVAASQRDTMAGLTQLVRDLVDAVVTPEHQQLARQDLHVAPKPHPQLTIERNPDPDSPYVADVQIPGVGGGGMGIDDDDR